MKKLIVLSLLFILVVSICSLYYQSYLTNKRDNEEKLRLLREISGVEEMMSVESDIPATSPPPPKRQQRLIVVPEKQLQDLILNQQRILKSVEGLGKVQDKAQ